MANVVLFDNPRGLRGTLEGFPTSRQLDFAKLSLVVQTMTRSLGHVGRPACSLGFAILFYFVYHHPHTHVIQDHVPHYWWSAFPQQCQLTFAIFNLLPVKYGTSMYGSRHFPKMSGVGSQLMGNLQIENAGTCQETWRPYVGCTCKVWGCRRGVKTLGHLSGYPLACEEIHKRNCAIANTSELSPV